MRRLATVLCLISAGAAAQPLRLSVPFTQFTLRNGLNVVLHQDRAIPAVSVNLWFKVGSGRERPGRTGIAHLFEHLMYEGSQHVPEGAYDEWLEAAGGQNNGSTSSDQTIYFADVPSNALELSLFLESDRMGYLVEAMSAAKVDGQRDVVKNERRESYENRPYGMTDILVDSALYPPAHPYHWPTIGSLGDLSAASFEDVVNFFRAYYVPGNASLSIAGDIDLEKTREMVERWFGDLPAGPPVPPMDPPAASLHEERRLLMEDRVQLPRLTMAWLTPAIYAPGDAELGVLSGVLAGGKNSRLYRRLVYDLQIAQDVSAYQASADLGSSFRIAATARTGHSLTELERAIAEEIDRVRTSGVTQRELDRAVNQYEASFLRRLEYVGGFGGKADQLNGYCVRTGNPDYFNEDVARYRALDPTDIQAAARTFLRDDARVVLSVVPRGKKALGAGGTEVSPK